jgi:DNA-binding NarL/FixJ family response regulator
MSSNNNTELSPRQREVMDLMCQGLPTRVIGERLHLSLHTVKEYRALVLKRMGVDNVVELVNKVNNLAVERRLAEQPTLQSVLSVPPNLVVVEDDESYRELVVSSLNQLGFPCRGVGCRQALQVALMSQQADIILLDLNLKDEDGLEIAKSLRDTGRYGIIMMTTRGTIQQRIDGLATGTDAYLVKPIDIRELVAVIRNLHRRLVE